MYTEESPKGKFPIRDILLKCLIAIIFIFLAIFIILKLTSPTNTINKSDTAYDRVFNKNLKDMENAAYKYFVDDKLPKNNNDTKKITLREMVNSNLLQAFVDKDKKSCDVNASYAMLTKTNDDYTLKLNLKCDKKSDYILTKVNKYKYCKYTICRKNITYEDVKEEKIKDTVDISDVNNGNSQVSISSKSNNTKSNNTLYEYKKVIPAVLSSWSDWSMWEYNTKGQTAIKCADNDVNCLKEVQLFSRKEQIGVSKDNKKVYATVNYYSYRTRTVISLESSDIKWSSYNNQNLLSNGYVYTGNNIRE